MTYANDWARDTVSIFSANGEREEVSRLNAVELVRYSGYSWKSPNETVNVVVETTLEPTKEESNVEEPTTVPTIEDEATEVTGKDDVQKYLDETYTKEALRTKLEADHGIKAAPAISKAKLIDMYIEAEASK